MIRIADYLRALLASPAARAFPGAGTAPGALIACLRACYVVGLSHETAGRMVLDVGAELGITGMGMAVLTRRQEGEAVS